MCCVCASREGDEEGEGERTDVERGIEIVSASTLARQCTHAGHGLAPAIRIGFYHTGEDEKENEGKRQYFRLLSVDASEDDAIDKLRDIFDKVFHNMATRVVVETTLEDETHVSELVASLRELPNLHFTQ